MALRHAPKAFPRCFAVEVGGEFLAAETTAAKLGGAQHPFSYSAHVHDFMARHPMRVHRRGPQQARPLVGCPLNGTGFGADWVGPCCRLEHMPPF